MSEHNFKVGDRVVLTDVSNCILENIQKRRGDIFTIDKIFQYVDKKHKFLTLKELPNALLMEERFRKINEEIIMEFKIGDIVRPKTELGGVRCPITPDKTYEVENILPYHANQILILKNVKMPSDWLGFLAENFDLAQNEPSTDICKCNIWTGCTCGVMQRERERNNDN